MIGFFGLDHSLMLNMTLVEGKMIKSDKTAKPERKNEIKMILSEAIHSMKPLILESAEMLEQPSLMSTGAAHDVSPFATQSCAHPLNVYKKVNIL